VQPFIWTEAVGCGEILPPVVESFLAHHQFILHVFGYEQDLINLPQSDRIVPMPIRDKNNESPDGLSFASEIRKAYRNGHEGTAFLWGAVISSRPEEYLIHLDSDTIFLDDVVSPIISKLNCGYGIVGTRRPYREQVKTNNVKGYRKVFFYFYRDAVNTHAFGFNRKAIKEKSFKIIQQKILYRHSNKLLQRIYPVIDFFDSVTFEITRSKGIFYLDSFDQQRSGKHNRNGEFERSMISFAAVGSGCNFYKNPESLTSESYKRFALASFSLYSKYLLDTEIGITPLESPYLVNLLERLDRNTWTLREL
jgi:hypothetical protein